jgi:hypothetical protein
MNQNNAKDSLFIKKKLSPSKNSKFQEKKIGISFIYQTITYSSK